MPADTPLHKAAHNGDKGALIQILDDAEIDVNAPGAAERRPLHRAAGGNHAELITILVEKGADVNCVRIDILKLNIILSNMVIIHVV